MRQMKILKSKREREAEQQQAFLAFLHSDEGHRGLCGLLVELQLSDLLEREIEAVKKQLLDQLNAEIQKLRVSASGTIEAARQQLIDQLNAEIRHLLAAIEATEMKLGDDNRRAAVLLCQKYQAEREEIAKHAANVLQDLVDRT
jgi:hypothetical protein